MPLIEMEMLQGATSDEQQTRRIERVMDGSVSVSGEALRPHGWARLTELAGRDWGVGGTSLAAAQVGLRSTGG